ncbi:SH3 domain [Lasallia pustulata]|uniref:SH3 domain n=1 Tax=Lasallia pustulata TaxID=136370 RepID=A0A1W5DB85_9LECA|nr:SH3 domain [Lasallia pustulata]
MTPPLTPVRSQEELSPRGEAPPPVFHNYLRAFYPYHPSCDEGASTVTLPLNHGDVVLVHSVHTNGWADGTLLTSGARGWLPTNYCEAYDQEPIRTLLKALTNFCDLVRGSSSGNLEAFTNIDYVHALVAGVRILLEKTECLNRESATVQAHYGLRRNRKALLSDLSSVVKLGRRLKDVATGAFAIKAVENDLGEVILKAFKMVTRCVKFLDIWNEEFGLSQCIDASIAALDSLKVNAAVPPTPPADISLFGAVERRSMQQMSESGSSVTCQAASASIDGEAGGSLAQHTSNRPRYNRMSQSYIRPGTSQSMRQTSSQNQRDSRRLSCRLDSSLSLNFNLASERLGAAHDGFLGFLGSFIGLHLQSRSSSEILLTTQQAVTTCRTLLAVVEEVWDRDLRRSGSLEEARDNMYGRLADLVEAAQDVFRPARNGEEGDVFLPAEGKRLVDAATTCVRGAGECVATARFVIERIGDFEFEPLGLGISTFDRPETATETTSTSECVENAGGVVTAAEVAMMPQPTCSPPPPPISLPDEQSQPLLRTSILPGKFGEQSLSLSVLDEDRAVASHSFEYAGKVLPPIPQLNSPLMPSDDYIPSAQALFSSSSNSESPISERQSCGAGSLDISSTASSSTYVSQASTRPTSVDCSNQQRTGYSSMVDSFSGSQTTLSDDCENGEAKILEKTFAHELAFNEKGQITGGTLPALIERLTTHDSTPDTLFVSTFYLTFRLFATPIKFAEALIDRFGYVDESPHTAGPVRLRVYNVFKGWLESHWRNDCDSQALVLILRFATHQLSLVLPTAGKRLTELAERVSSVNGALVPRLISSIGKTNTSIAHYVAPDTPLPAPIISKNQLAALRTWKSGGPSVHILDFDPLELARQFTIKESRIFCSILPEELLAQEWTKKSGSVAVNVRAMSTLSTDLSNLVADSILQLEDAKKRAVIIKQWVKIAKKCFELNNYDSLIAIICSLNSSTIIRLKRTWDIVSAKTKTKLEKLKGIVEISRNYADLRRRLQYHVPPCLPFVGMYLTDLTMVDHGNQTTRQLPGDGNGPIKSVINFDKHMKTARIISELQRFQIPYRLTEVPELQTWIQDQLVRVRSSGQSNVQLYYRRSLMLEPREQILRPAMAETLESNSSGKDASAKDRFDLFGWSHLSREKQGLH